MATPAPGTIASRLRAQVQHSVPLTRLWRVMRGSIQGALIRRDHRQHLRQYQKAGGLASDLEERRVWMQVHRRLRDRGIDLATRRQPLHILYATKPSGWEPHNIPPAISSVADLSLYYLYERIPGAREMGEWALRQHCDADLLAFVSDLHRRRPIDVMLSYLCGTQLSAAVVERINSMGIATALFHLDDRLHFDATAHNGFASGPAAVAAAYDVCLTASDDSIVKYAVRGGRAVLWPEGGNPDIFRPLETPRIHDVAFVGARYGHRSLLIDYLRRHGVHVACFGAGWEQGGVSDTRMVEIFSQSRIVLGFGYIGYSDEQHFKGRDFEVPMCGCVYLTSSNRYVEQVYDVGREILVYRDPADCLRIIRELLADPTRCDTIRTAARRRALASHTWRHRIEYLLAGLAGHPRPLIEPPITCGLPLAGSTDFCPPAPLRQ